MPKPARKAPARKKKSAVLPVWGVGRVAVLGLDPATSHLGLVALGWDGELLDWHEWSITGPIYARYTQITHGLCLALKELRPAALAWELGHGKYFAPEADVVLRMLPGLAKLAGVPEQRYTPSAWRMTVCGDGGLSKAGAWDMMALGYPEFRGIEGGNARDAFGIAQCWLERNKSDLARALSEPGARLIHASIGRKP